MLANTVLTFEAVETVRFGFRMHNALVLAVHDKYSMQGQVMRPERIINHPDYDANTDQHDIALIKASSSGFLCSACRKDRRRAGWVRIQAVALDVQVTQR